MARDVAERLARHRQQLGHDLDRQVLDRVRVVGRGDRDVDGAVSAKLGRQVSEAIGQAAGLEQRRAQAEDEVADVADDRVQRVDRLVDAAGGLRRVLADQLGNIVERKGLRVDGLDHAVVEITADPVSLVHDRQPADLVVQSGVLDGDPGVQREHLDQRLVLRAELGRIAACW